MTAVRADTERGSAELAVVMIGVFALLSMGLMLGVNWLAAQAALTAYQRNRSPGQATQSSCTSVGSQMSERTAVAA